MGASTDHLPGIAVDAPAGDTSGTGSGSMSEATVDAAAPAVVTDLRLVAVTPARTHLLLEDSARRQFQVPVDARLANALRRPDRSPTAQLEIALESQLTPREIQSRVRGGHSVEEVAVAAGISTERVERYASPVLAERAHVVEQAQKAPARRATAGSAPSLGEVVDLRLAQQKVASDSISWDAWRGEDERWTVRLGYLGAGKSRVATWSFDPRGRVLAPADDEARWLVDGTSGERMVEDQPAVRRLSAVPHPEGAGAGALAAPGPTAQGPAGDEVYDREADVPPTGPASEVRGRRQPVPSWDDIMFGPRKRD